MSSPSSVNLHNRIINRIKETSNVTSASYIVGANLRCQPFTPRLAQPFMDEIDRVLAHHCGFTDEELDFIIYDIKYRIKWKG